MFGRVSEVHVGHFHHWTRQLVLELRWWRRRRTSRNTPEKNQNTSVQNLKLTSQTDSLSQQLLTVEATDVAVMDIIKNASSETGQSYYYFSLPEGKLSTKLKDVTYEQLLSHVLLGTKHTFKKEGDIYIIGEKSQEGLQQTKVVQLQHRSAQDITKSFPQEVSAF